MLSFSRFKPEYKAAMDECLAKMNHRVTEGAFSTYFLWDEKYRYEVAFSEGFLFTRIHENGRPAFLCPMGEGDFAGAIEEIKNFCRQQGECLHFSYINTEALPLFEKHFPDEFIYTTDRDSAEYLYLAEDIIALTGKKLHAKRNFINRFKRDYEGRWTFERITKDNVAEVLEYEACWQRDNRTDEGDLEVERSVIEKQLRNMDFLGSVGGLLRLDGRIIGFSLGTKISPDTFDIQIEKADWEIQGAYQILNNEFARTFCTDVVYINREDDMGLEGLRKAKLSYHPHKLIIKYSAVYKTVRYQMLDFRDPVGKPIHYSED